MYGSLGFKKYRAILGNETAKAFTIVTVTENGNMSWAVITEQEFNEVGHEDLPDDLFAQVNDIYIKIGMDDDAIDEGV